MIHAAAARKRGGHGERPAIHLVTMWIGPTASNSRNSPAMRVAARQPTVRPLGPARETGGGGGLAIAVEGDAVELHPMVDQPEAELLRDPLLEFLEFVVDKLDDVARFHIDQVVVVRFGRSFIP